MISKRHLTRRPYCAALVPAAGKSERMGGTDKLTAQLGGIPVLERTLLANAYLTMIVILTLYIQVIQE